MPAAGEEQRISTDPRFDAAIELFNDGQWYAAHDGLEELWHETNGPCRPVLQGILQIAVAQLHLERGNQRGAVILLGEGLGRLRRGPDQVLALDLGPLKAAAQTHLQHLQASDAAADLPAPCQLPPLRLVRTQPV
ncbi:MAG: DUF309 domain-containing protein [Cyanobacteriota bacterium]|nr:DUF309 domain-containing protein [Cyanobacteriota bacterium]